MNEQESTLTVSKALIYGSVIIALVIAVLVVTGQWGFVYYNLFIDYQGNSWLSNIILLIVVVGAISTVLISGKKMRDE